MNTPDKILRLSEVKITVGLSASSIYRMIKVGDFPAQIKLGKHASGWLEADVQNWILKKSGKLPANDEQSEQAA